MLLPALVWGSAPGDPVHDEIRPDAGAAIYESASTCRTIGARAVATRPGVSGAVRRWVLTESSAFYSPGFYPTLEVSPSVSQAISSPIASVHRALCSGSYASPLTQRWCSTTESLRATATTARFLAFLPPREAILWP